MNKYLLGLLLTLSSVCFGQSSEDPIFAFTGTTVTNAAASTTNATAGSIVSIQQSPYSFRAYLSASGTAATTNGVSAVSNLVVRLSTASGSVVTTNAFDSAENTSMVLTLGNIITPGTTKTASKDFEARGIKFVRVSSIENNLLGTVSNIQVIIAYPR